MGCWANQRNGIWQNVVSFPGHVSVAHRGRTLVWGGYMENQVLHSKKWKGQSYGEYVFLHLLLTMWCDIHGWDDIVTNLLFRMGTMITTGAQLRCGFITAWPGVGQSRSRFYLSVDYYIPCKLLLSTHFGSDQIFSSAPQGIFPQSAVDLQLVSWMTQCMLWPASTGSK